jgi:UDP-galactopyranose mutase
MEHNDTHRLAALTNLLLDFASHRPVRNLISWYYSPLALPYTRSLLPRAVVYDCMDDLSAFVGANPALSSLEEELFRRADVVFTGGRSLYRAKRHLHHNVHAYPSGVDADHFGRARARGPDPQDQADIPHPRAGFAGVIDERLDLELLGAVAAAHPRMQFVMIGPIVKIEAASVPRAPNIWYLGRKNYAELPSYEAGWDVAIMPFAHNAATRSISPTKTLEYLAAGRPVVSTSIADVLDPYGTGGLVHIADSPAEFVKAIDAAIAEDAAARWERAEAMLRQHSWDEIWLAMSNHLRDVIYTGRHAHWDSLRATYS